MGKLKFTLSNILFWLGLIPTCLILEDVGFLSTNPTGSLSEPHFFMLFALAIGCYLSYFLIEHIKNKASLDYVLLTIVLFCFAGGMLAIWSFQGVTLDGIRHYEYSVTTWDKVMQTFSLMVYVLGIYAVLFYFNKNHPSIRKIKVIYFIIAAICLFATIFSWIKETNKILYNLSATGAPLEIKSIFWNPNMYSLMLLLGVYSCFGLNYYKKHFVNYLLIIYFAFMECVVCSLTGVAVMAASLVVYFLIEIIFVMRRRKGLGIFYLGIYLAVLISFVVLLACSLNYDLGGLSSFFKFLYSNFADAHYGDLSKRTFTWSCSVEYIGNHPFNLMFGFGFKNSNHIIGGFWNAYKGTPINWLSAHSGYIQLLMNFGIVGIIGYALFFLYYIYSFSRIFKKDPRFALIYLLIGGALIGYAVMESIIFLAPSSLGFIILAFFYLPMMNKWKHYKHPQLGDDVIEVSKPKSMPSSQISKSLAKLFMALIATACAFFIFPKFNSSIRGMYFLVNMIVVLVMSALFVPFIIASISKNHSRKVGAILSTLNFALSSFPIVYLGVRYYLNSSFMSSGAEWLLPVFVFMILVGEALIYGIGKRQKFKDYLSTLVGLSKNSFMGLIGAGAIILISYFVLDYMDLLSPLTYIIYPFIVIVAFYLTSYLVSFKDQKAYLQSYNESLLYSMKMDVLKDRLGDYNEKRRD